MNIIDSKLKFKNGLSKRKTTKRIILHHSASNNTSVQTIHQWHLNRGWSGIGYNFYVRKDGSVYKGRGIEYVGAHCSNYNSTSVGICFEGNYDSIDKVMPEVQFNSGVELISWVLSQYSSISEICDHKKYGATACAGRYFPLSTMIASSTGSNSSGGGSSSYSPSYNVNVLSFQKAWNKDNPTKKIKEDGIEGKDTNNAKKSTIVKAGAKTLTGYKVGTVGSRTSWVQSRLVDTYDDCKIKVDGKCGKETRSWIGIHQKNKNLTVDYMAGMDTISSLL